MTSTIDTVKIFMSDRYRREPPLPEETITEISRRLNLPDDYANWMRWSNEGEGNFGDMYLTFWPLDELEQLNKDFLVQHYLGAEVLCFGTDGGGTGYVFKSLPNDTSIWSVPLGDLDWSAASKIGDDLGSALFKALTTIDAINIKAIQRQKCDFFESPAAYPDPYSRIGIALQTRGQQPVTGMRALPDQECAGWYIWAGDYSSAKDFFQSVHVGHVLEFWPELLPYLALAPDYRFIIDDEGYEDVWKDPVITMK
ncbi:SMI1/KNR4 family protein [Delftia acidovorans]|uniref:SMI1/KNR4 family protein n=1 Tax=Delftia acidovorans TaxID=80866 RepID=UPI000BC3FB1F|nr:SMI1/KNR4 family protein [Delftia acidovorans]SOE36114.1 hypothetical protein SAMN05216519_2114 [Delftia acidovorans]